MKFSVARIPLLIFLKQNMEKSIFFQKIKSFTHQVLCASSPEENEGAMNKMGLEMKAGLNQRLDAMTKILRSLFLHQVYELLLFIENMSKSVACFFYLFVTFSFLFNLFPSVHNTAKHA